MLKFLGCLITLIVSPAKGWDNIERHDDEVPELLNKGFYPLVGVTSLTDFIQYFYAISPKVSVYVVNVIITFVAFVISYFFSSFLFSFFLKKMTDSQVSERSYNTFILYSLACLAVIMIIENCMPMQLSIVEFLPIFVLLVMWLGNKYLHIGDNKGVVFIIFCALTILVPPYLFSYLFGLLLN